MSVVFGFIFALHPSISRPFLTPQPYTTCKNDQKRYSHHFLCGIFGQNPPLEWPFCDTLSNFNNHWNYFLLLSLPFVLSVVKHPLNIK